MSRSSSIELFERLKRDGVTVALKGGRIAVLGKRKALTPSLLEEIRAHSEALKLILEKGTHQALCFGCGKRTIFYPTPRVMDVFRHWECGECGWKVWRREEGAYPDGTLEAIIRAFRGSVVHHTPGNSTPPSEWPPEETVTPEA